MKNKGLSTAALKAIALLSMTLDHIGVAFEQSIPVWAYLLLRTVGRMAFVMFCFFIVQGFLHTKSIGKYALRLGIFALLCEIPFDLFLHGEPFSWSGQNVMITLLLGLLSLWAYEKFKSKMLLALLCVAALCVAALLLKSDYGLLGVLLIFILYQTRNNPKAKYLLSALLLFLLGLSGGNILTGLIQLAGLAGLALCELYNGRQGPKLKYLFYIYYPAHMLLLYFICSWLF